MTRSNAFDHLLIFGYGSPSAENEVEPFLRNISELHPIPEDRIRQVMDQYKQIGGSSPYTNQIRALTQKLKDHLNPTAVFSAMLFGNPSLKETLDKISYEGLHHGLCFIASPQRSVTSFDRYRDQLQNLMGRIHPALDYKICEPWHCHSKFIEAHTQSILACHKAISENGALIFTAHAIPKSDPELSRYEYELRQTANHIMKRIGLSEGSIAYHSKSSQLIEWTQPELGDVLKKLKKAGKNQILIDPIGFICDNAEILYDLDIQARNDCISLGMEYNRCETVIHQSSFFQMLLEQMETS